MMKQAFDAVIREWGYSAFLQRHLSGGGFEAGLEEWTIRLTHKSALTITMQERFAGVVHTFDVLFYFQSEAKPTEGDRIYTLDDRYPEQQATWIIQFAEPMHGLKGEIAYWEAGARRENPN